LSLLFGVTADESPPPQRRAAAVDHRGAKVLLRIAVHQVGALMHTDEYVLHDVFRGAPVAEDERGYADEFAAVQPEHLIEATARICAQLHIDDTNCGPGWLLASSGKYFLAAVSRGPGLAVAVSFPACPPVGSQDGAAT
jgi:hypothetical protein